MPVFVSKKSNQDLVKHTVANYKKYIQFYMPNITGSCQYEVHLSNMGPMVTFHVKFRPYRDPQIKWKKVRKASYYLLCTNLFTERAPSDSWWTKTISETEKKKKPSAGLAHMSVLVAVVIVGYASGFIITKCVWYYSVTQFKVGSWCRQPYSEPLTKWSIPKGRKAIWGHETHWRSIVDGTRHTHFGWTKAFWAPSTSVRHGCWWAISPILVAKHRSTPRRLPGIWLRPWIFCGNTRRQCEGLP